MLGQQLFDLTAHCSLLTTHYSIVAPHSSLLTPHSSFLTPHSSLLQKEVGAVDEGTRGVRVVEASSRKRRRAQGKADAPPQHKQARKHTATPSTHTPSFAPSRARSRQVRLTRLFTTTNYPFPTPHPIPTQFSLTPQHVKTQSQSQLDSNGTILCHLTPLCTCQPLPSPTPSYTTPPNPSQPITPTPHTTTPHPAQVHPTTRPVSAHPCPSRPIPFQAEPEFTPNVRLKLNYPAGWASSKNAEPVSSRLMSDPAQKEQHRDEYD